jgi:hypothetical protein
MPPGAAGRPVISPDLWRPVALLPVGRLGGRARSPCTTRNQVGARGVLRAMAHSLSGTPVHEAGVGSWPTLLAGLLLTLLNVSCANGGSITRSAQTPTASASPAASTLAALGRIPPDCASPRELWPQHPGPWNVAFGRSPVWIKNVSTAPGSGAALIPLYPSSGTTWGYETKLLWIVEPGFAGAVTITAGNASTGKRVYMRSGGAPPSTAPLVLDPQHPGIPNSGDPNAPDPQLRYAAFPTSIFIDAAGCIEFEATWATGHWAGAVAAGHGQ